jgi:hypothetical protein
MFGDKNTTKRKGVFNKFSKAGNAVAKKQKLEGGKAKAVFAEAVSSDEDEKNQNQEIEQEMTQKEIDEGSE